MSDNTTVAEPSLDEAIRAAFAKPATSEGALITMPSVSISDAIITAQKVAVERDDAKVLQKIKIFAAAAGEDWYYRYPVSKRGGGQDWIEGPSIKCANNVARFYGNCQVDTRVVDNGDSWIIYARFVDYETGFSYTRPFQQRKGQTSIKSKDVDRQLDIALQIGVSKAIRNVVCNALETFANFAFEEAKGAIVEKVGKRLDHYRARVLERLAALKIDASRVEANIGRAQTDWLAPDIARLIAQIQAVNDGMATIEETWPAPQSDAPPRPQRSQFMGPASGPQPAADLVEVANFVGEFTEYPTIDTAVEAYRAALDEGERQRGEAGLSAVWEANTSLMNALLERGHGDLHKQLSEEYGLRRQAAAERDAEAKRRSEQTSLRDEPAERPAERKAPVRSQGVPIQKPPRSEIWGEASFALMGRKLLDGSPDAVAMRDDLLFLIEEAESEAELDKLWLDNSPHRDALGKEAVGEIMAASEQRRAEIARSAVK